LPLEVEEAMTYYEFMNMSDTWWDNHGDMVDLSVVILAVIIGAIYWIGRKVYARHINRRTD